MEKLGLYIHIPFCEKKCNYCDFLSLGGQGEETMERYVEALIAELAHHGRAFRHRVLSTVYIGGGTPSVLPESSFKGLMIAIREHFDIEQGAEITMEMNPGTLTDGKIRLYKQMGINRGSMGLQSDDDEQLVELGRIHTFADYKRTYDQLRDVGIRNINVDVMFGLHKQSMEQWQQTLERVIALNPEHISAYSLIVEPHTLYEQRYENGELSLPDEETEREMFWYAHKRLEAAGYHHYEISNYAREHFISRHNSSYWDLTEYIGAGLGASSYYNGCRYRNMTGLTHYIEAEGDIKRIRLLEQEEDVTLMIEEAFFLGLRRLDGLSIGRIKDRFGDKALAPYFGKVTELMKEDLLLMDGDMLRLTDRGVDISNQVLSRFLLDQ